MRASPLRERARFCCVMKLAAWRRYTKCNRAVKATAHCYHARQIAERRRNCIAAGLRRGCSANLAHPDILKRGGFIVA